MEELYFCLYLTETEHSIAEWDIRQECLRLGLDFRYYRKLKDGHVPMYREIKVVGERTAVNRFKKWMASDGVMLDGQVKKNPYKE